MTRFEPATDSILFILFFTYFVLTSHLISGEWAAREGRIDPGVWLSTGRGAGRGSG